MVDHYMDILETWFDEEDMIYIISDSDIKNYNNSQY